jgi:hypothetical protein
MKKMICLISILLSISILFLNGSELGNKNLKGIRYIIIAAEFNGVLYEKGYVDREEETVKEFNLKKAAAKLQEDGIPITHKDIRRIYRQMESLLQKAELETLGMKKYSEEKTTLVPTLTAGVDTMPAAENMDLYVTVVHLTLSKWLSNWAGTKRILAPVYTWSEKRMATASAGELTKTIETTVAELTKEFIKEWQQANPENEGD